MGWRWLLCRTNTPDPGGQLLAAGSSGCAGVISALAGIPQSFISAHRPAPLMAADRAGIGRPQLRLCLSCASRPYFRSLTRTRLCYLRTWSVGVSFGDKVGAPPTFSRAVTSRPDCPLLGVKAVALETIWKHSNKQEQLHRELVQGRECAVVRVKTTDKIVL